MMNRDELKLAIAKALCEDAYPGCDYKPEGSAYPSTWEALQEGFLAQTDVCLTTLEAAGVDLAPKKPTSTMIRDGVSHRLSTKISGENTWPEDTAALYTAMLAASPYRSAP